MRGLARPAWVALAAIALVVAQARGQPAQVAAAPPPAFCGAATAYADGSLTQDFNRIGQHYRAVGALNRALQALQRDIAPGAPPPDGLAADLADADRALAALSAQLDRDDEPGADPTIIAAPEAATALARLARLAALRKPEAVRFAALAGDVLAYQADLAALRATVAAGASPDPELLAGVRERTEGLAARFADYQALVRGPSAEIGALKAIKAELVAVCAPPPDYAAQCAATLASLQAGQAADPRQAVGWMRQRCDAAQQRQAVDALAAQATGSAMQMTEANEHAAVAQEQTDLRAAAEADRQRQMDIAPLVMSAPAAPGMEHSGLEAARQGLGVAACGELASAGRDCPTVGGGGVSAAGVGATSPQQCLSDLRRALAVMRANAQTAYHEAEKISSLGVDESGNIAHDNAVMSALVEGGGGPPGLDCRSGVPGGLDQRQAYEQTARVNACGGASVVCAINLVKGGAACEPSVNQCRQQWPVPN